MNHTHPSTAPETLCLLPPPCPVCGGLECLCRPRFFAGQLLSEEDLRALDHYIIEKNKLHNRYLHGWGVVCGLEVVCHECKGWVTIKSGYALDPCGNDIIVCQDYCFDLCAKIRECCDRKCKDWECEPMASPPPDCKDVEKCWYVTLRYREFESRGITALRATSTAPCCPQCGSPSSQCRCGSGCGCSSNGYEKRVAKPANTSFRRPAPQCEPTRLCEGYVVEIAPAPRHAPRNANLFEGTFGAQIAKCISSVAEVASKAPKPNEPGGIAGFKQVIWDFLRSHAITRCELFDKVRDARSVEQLKDVLADYLKGCLCLAFLPPCAADPGDPRVILACVTVKGEECHIVNICNLAGRHTIPTWPNIQYWISIVRLSEAALETFCCAKSPPIQR